MNIQFFISAFVYICTFSAYTVIAEKSVYTSNTAPMVSWGKCIRIDRFPSTFVQARTIDILLPQGYNPQQTYHVIYMHDGQMLFDSTYTWNHQEWQIDEVFEQYQDSLYETIIVGIWNNNEFRHAEYFPQKALAYMYDSTKSLFLSEKFKGKALADNYLHFIVDELKPFIDNAFSVSKKPEHTMMMGSSMGGLISLYALCEYPNVFGAAAGLSTHWIGTTSIDNGDIPRGLITYISNNLPKAELKRKFYTDHGTIGLDSLYPNWQTQIDSLFLSKGYDHTQYMSAIFEDADHNEEAWSQRLYVPLLFLLKKP
jgi:hypothetical protein